MALITERLNANKPSAAAVDAKNAKLAINNNKDLDVDSKKEEPSFFGSFFAGKKNQKKGPNTPAMESVSPSSAHTDWYVNTNLSVFGSPRPSSVPNPHSMNGRRWRRM